MYWSKDKCGYDPGQKETLSVDFVSRNKGTVVVKYKFTAKSLGRDDFVYKERHNKVTIWVGGVSVSHTYQLHGNKASTSKSGNITIYGVGDTSTKLAVHLKNDRIWVNQPADSWSPRSTGVLSKTHLGNVGIARNTRALITFYSGCSSSEGDIDVATLPNKGNSFYIYNGGSYTIPNTTPIDKKNYWVFKGYNSSYTGDVNLGNKQYGQGSVINVNISGDTTLNYYVCWNPQTYDYSFYKSGKDKPQSTSLFTNNDIDSKFIIEHVTFDPNPIIHTHKVATEVPDLDIIGNNYREGYTFDTWNYNKASSTDNFIVSRNTQHILDNVNESEKVDFWPKWESITTQVTFDYLYDSRTHKESYTYADSNEVRNNFNFSNVLLDKNNQKVVDNTKVRPGYKLIGWTYDFNKANTIYEPFKGPSCEFPSSGYQIITYKSGMTNEMFRNGITLYAVWEYYTTSYVYTNNKWHLALPYVYKDGKWHICLSYVFNNNWKL